MEALSGKREGEPQPEKGQWTKGNREFFPQQKWHNLYTIRIDKEQDFKGNEKREYTKSYMNSSQ